MAVAGPEKWGVGELTSYIDFRHRKMQGAADTGFVPTFMPDFLFPFQAHLLDWGIRKGCAAFFEDCGMGKTPQELVWCENMVRETNKPSLLLTTLAVAPQTVREAEKFGIDAERSRDGHYTGKRIVVTNYDQLHKFNWQEFGSVACDESSILKNFKGAMRSEITEFMRKVPYRSLWTATGAPNEFLELGTSSEALGHLGYMDMIHTFFTNDRNNTAMRSMYGEAPEWRFRGHAEEKFWRWVTSWARAVRRPSDIGFADEGFELPELIEREVMVDYEYLAPGALLPTPAATRPEQLAERRASLEQRSEAMAAKFSDPNVPGLIGCHLNPEGDLLERLIPDCVQVSGTDCDEAKEEKILAFQTGQVSKMVTKMSMGAWGLNFQHCGHIGVFPDHSYEQYYQFVRRCLRYGRVGPVEVDIVMTEGQRRIRQNVQRKAEEADRMFERIVAMMNDALGIVRPDRHTKEMEIPAWLS